MKPHKGFALTLGVDLSEIDRVNGAFADFADAEDLPPKICGTLRMVFDELLNNAISYGFRGRDVGEIRVEVALDGDLLTVTLADDGQPFDPLQLDAPDTTRATQERSIGGLGIYLVRQAMDDVTYARVADRNVLTLTKTITDE